MRRVKKSTTPRGIAKEARSNIVVGGSQKYQRKQAICQTVASMEGVAMGHVVRGCDWSKGN